MLNLYTETAAQAAPATISSVIDFSIPRKNGSYDRSRYSAKSTDTHTKDEQDYTSHYLASAGDIYFRESKAHQPRSVLWRVTGQQRVLELFPADLSRSEDDTKEAHLTLRFAFQDPILPAGVAITDSDAEAGIHAFICTTKNEIFHLRIHPDAFRTADAISTDIGQWCSALEISSLSIETVFRLHAHSPLEVIICYTSGKLQRLQRKRDGSTWTPENYDDRTWGASLRGIVGRRTTRTIEHGSTSIDTRAVQAMQLSSDSNYLFTVCLNHQLRIWHLASGRLAIATDLLDKAREPNEKLLLNPGEAGRLQLYKLDHMKNSILVTYSPREGGQLKFWDVKGGLTDPLSVEDRYPQLRLTPPDPDPSGNTIWSMAGFRMVPCAVDPLNSVRLWVLWRNNNHHQLYSTRFVLNDADRSWKSEWVACTPSSSKKPSPPDIVKSSPEDLTAQWLDFLLCPGRYTTPVLETALSIYSDAIATKVPAAQKTNGLKARLCAVVAANVSLRKYDQSITDFDRFWTDLDYQWRNFYRIVGNVNDGRLAPLALAYDLFTAEPWIVMADKCCAVRESNKMELVTQNEPTELDDLEEVCETLWAHRKVSAEERGIAYEKLAQLVTATRNFRENFSSELAYKLEAAVENDLLTNPESTTSTRILELYDDIGFGDAVSDDSFHQLQRDFKPLGELETFSNDLVMAVLDLLPQTANQPANHLRSTVFGLGILAGGTFDLMTSTRSVLWDLLVLVVFVEGELNQDEEKMSSFDAAEIFTLITAALKTLDWNIWLATHSRAVPLDFVGTAADPKPRSGLHDIPSEECRSVSILEDSLWKAIRPRPVADTTNTYLLTETLHDIQGWVSGDEALGYDNGTVYLQCDLLAHGEIDLAGEYLRFQPSTPWSAYIKGRLYLFKNAFDLAAHYFRQSGYCLACGKAVGDLTAMSAGLLSPLDVESFNNGMPRYLQHVLSLFESSQAYTQMATFARLALQSLIPGQKESSSSFRSEILSRLFTAELQVARFEAAFDALVQFSDHALQKSCATSLINAILDASRSASSISGAVQTLQSLPWSLYPVLSKHLEGQLSILARKQKSSSSNTLFAGADGSIDYLKVVHAMRVARGDTRGAVAVLYERLRLIQQSRRVRGDPTMKDMRYALLSLINAMTLISPDEAYILAEAEEPADQVNGGRDGSSSGRKRRKVIITLQDLRKDYQRVLDRCARVERGDFEFDVAEDQSDYASDAELEHSRLDLNRGSRRWDSMEM